LGEVARDHPDELASVFSERRGTVESSFAYLETLASNYARLSPQLSREACDVNVVVRDSVPRLGTAGGTEVRLDLAEGLPTIRTDPLVLRRILENLVRNALDSLESTGGTVTVATERVDSGSREPVVRVSVRDTGKGMTREQLDRAFDDFYSTKAGGTGLGLSIVRRLVLDANGTLRVETAPGAGARFIVELPGQA
jgi:signal transduction histidine kinase